MTVKFARKCIYGNASGELFENTVFLVLEINFMGRIFLEELVAAWLL
jgi:hypothetical protein